MSEQQSYEQLGWVGWKGQDGWLTAFFVLVLKAVMFTSYLFVFVWEGIRRVEA